MGILIFAQILKNLTKRRLSDIEIIVVKSD